MTGARAVVEALCGNGVDLVFGIPGTHNLEIYRALAASPIRHVTPRHEQGAGYAADGYYRVTGRPGVCVTTSGPGLTNICTAVATAYADSIPMLVISPGVPRGMERADVGWLHEMKDSQAHLDAIVARSIRVASADEAVDAVNESFARWRVERPRPVHLEVPLDVLDGPWSGVVAGPRSVAPTAPDVGAAPGLIAGARSPVLVLGGGARHAAAAARTFAEAWDSPVITTVNGKGVLSETHPLSLGASIRLEPAQRLVDDADVVLFAGTELGDSDLWGGTISPRGRVIRVDVDPAQSHKNVGADVAIVGDAGTALTMLAGMTRTGRGGAARAAAARTEITAAALVDGAPWRAVQDILRAALPGDTVVAGDSAQVSYYGTVHFWPVESPGSFLYPPGYATLGYGLPAAIGAKLGAPGRPVLVLVGDGGFLFTVQELVTAVEQRLPLPIVVVDNGGYGEIRAQMDERGIPRTGVDLVRPDFAALARACGAYGHRIDDPAQLADLVPAALDADRPTVIHLPVPEFRGTGQAGDGAQNC